VHTLGYACNGLYHCSGCSRFFVSPYLSNSDPTAGQPSEWNSGLKYNFICGLFVCGGKSVHVYPCLLCLRASYYDAEHPPSCSEPVPNGQNNAQQVRLTARTFFKGSSLRVFFPALPVLLSLRKQLTVVSLFLGQLVVTFHLMPKPLLFFSRQCCADGRGGTIKLNRAQLGYLVIITTRDWIGWKLEFKLDDVASQEKSEGARTSWDWIR